MGNKHHHQIHHHDTGDALDYGPLCATISELIPAYSIGATNPDETQLVEVLLPFCPEARTQLAEYQQIGDSLLHLAPDAGDPPQVEALLQKLAALEAEADSGTVDPVDETLRDVLTPLPAPLTAPPASHDSASEPLPFPAIVDFPAQAAAPVEVRAKVTPRQGRSRTSQVLIGFLAAAVVLLAGATVYWAQEVLRLQEEQGELIAALAEQTGDTPLAGTVTVSGPDRYRELLPAEPIAEGASARFVWNVEQQVGAVFATGLPQLEEGRVYQVWVVTLDGAALSLGTFSVDAIGEGALVFKAGQPIENYTHIGISIEPEDGSPNPTTEHLVVGVI